MRNVLMSFYGSKKTPRSKATWGGEDQFHLTATVDREAKAGTQEMEGRNEAESM